MKVPAIILALTLALAAIPVWSAGSGGDSDSAATQVPADPDFKAGEQAVKKKEWATAVTRLTAVVQRNDKNADAWNYLGYSYRHLGEMDKSFAHYDKALQINPNHRGAHEYLGEAYLAQGRLAEAEAQLKALDKICWLPCEEFRDLKAKVAQYRKEHAM